MSQSSASALPPVVAVVGPTAAGKSALAVEIARHFDGEIVNFDSRQVYRGLDIGTAKPDARLRAEVPHHGYELRNPDQSMSAGLYLRWARRMVRAIEGRGRLPILVGGTGFYLRTLRLGLSPSPPTPRRLRATLGRVLASAGSRAPERWLRVLDPRRGREIRPNDRARALRAIEVVLLTGRQMSAQLGQRRGGLERSFVIVGCEVPIDVLYNRIARRVEDMLSIGWGAEVERCLAAGIPASAPGLTAIGYPELMDHLAGRLTASACRERIAIATRQYAKRQRTWFRREPGVEWFDTTRAASAEIIRSLADRLGACEEKA